MVNVNVIVERILRAMEEHSKDRPSKELPKKG